MAVQPWTSWEEESISPFLLADQQHHDPPMSAALEQYTTDYVCNDSITCGLYEDEYEPTNSTGDPDAFDVRSFYRTAIPIMLVFCIISIVTNVIIVASVRWVRSNLSPTLCFSISLAVADAYASLVIGVGLVINSLLFIGYHVDLLGKYYSCFALTLEAFRLAGMITSVLHLLALAINHYIGIVWPLHYAATITRRNTMISIGVMWTVSIFFFFIYFASLEGEGFQAHLCENFNFLAHSPFRIVLCTLFFIPLVLMVFAYLHIFFIVRQHQRGLLQHQNRSEDRKKLKANIKATITTLLILGTYVIGWMPAVIWSLLTCLDCAYPFLDLPEGLVIQVSFAINTLIIVKSLVDPIVYAARMKKISDALNVMCSCGRLTAGGRRGRGGRTDDTYSSFRCSRSETTGTSLRLQSVYGRAGNHKDSSSEKPMLIYQTTKEVIVTTTNHDLVNDNGSC